MIVNLPWYHGILNQWGKCIDPSGTAPYLSTMVYRLSCIRYLFDLDTQNVNKLEISVNSLNKEFI